MTEKKALNQFLHPLNLDIHNDNMRDVTTNDINTLRAQCNIYTSLGIAAKKQ